MNLRLEQLEPEFLTFVSDGHWRTSGDIHGAQGIQFLCPKCFLGNGCSNIGVHSVVCWFKGKGVPDTEHPKPGRWNPQGMGFHDLSFIGPGSTSVLLTSGCLAHFHVVNGEIIFCS